MPRVFFWNLKRKDLGNLVCDAVNAVSADVVVLLENTRTASDMLKELSSKVSREFVVPSSTPGRFQLFSRSASLGLSEIYCGDRLSIRELSLGTSDFFLGIIHIADKMYWDPMHQATEVQLLAETVRHIEEARGHDRTVLVGDFNMNPFDQAMNMAPGMNAMMTETCVKPGSRVQQGRKYPFFYNPMWALFGDRTFGPAGTYYHTTASSGNYGWNMLDQVLVRPSALQWFVNVQILTSAGERSLKTKTGRPDRNNASDHFPILLELKRGTA